MGQNIQEGKREDSRAPNVILVRLAEIDSIVDENILRHFA